MSTDVLIIIKLLERYLRYMEGHRWTFYLFFLPSVNSNNVKVDLYIWAFEYLALIKNTSTYLIDVTCLTTRENRHLC